MRNLAFRIEYDGTHFHGYQRQREQVSQAGAASVVLPTIQGLLEEILGTVLDEPVEVVCAGRTDAGVHALGQVVHVHTRSTRPLAVVVRALEGLAHRRIGVRAAWEAEPWFHARHHASRRVYQYHLLCQASCSPLLEHMVHRVPMPLDLNRMRAEAKTLLGRRDFRSFHSGGTDLRHFFRTVHRFEIHRLRDLHLDPRRASHALSWLGAIGAHERLVVAEIEADAFLPHMVRLMMGTLLAVGTGRRPRGTVAEVLRARDPRHASNPAPSHGLCLVKVEYPERCRVPPDERAILLEEGPCL